MQAKVSFTQKVKEEVVSVPFSDEHLRGMLASFIKINGVLKYSKDKQTIVLRTENAKIAKFIYHAIERIYGVPCRFTYSKAMNFKKRLFYNIVIEEADYIIQDLEISFIEGKISKNIVCNDDMIAAYLGGAFLATGSCNTPKKSNYHLEITVNDENYAKWFSKLFNKFSAGEFTAKIIKRRNSYVVYLKRSQQIADFLILIGATNATLEFENIRVDRDFSNISNRLENLDTANYNKITAAAEKQIDDIKVIDKRIGISNIRNEKQRELMRIRLENDDLSLFELAELLSKKIGKQVTRSNINHLFRAIHIMAEQCRTK